jgi:hypothetical protein
VAPAAPGAALPIQRGEAGELPDFCRGHVPELGQEAEQDARGLGPDPRHALQQVILRAPQRAVVQEIIEVGVEQVQLALEVGDVFADLPPERVARLAPERLEEPRFLGAEHLLHLLLAGEEIAQRVLRRGRERPALGLDARAKGGEHVGVERVGLRELAGRLREVAHLPRIHHHDRQPSTPERGDDAPLIPARRLDHDQLHAQRCRRPGERVHQRVLPRPRVRIRRGLGDPIARHDQLRLRDIDSQIATHRAVPPRHRKRPCTRSVLYARSPARRLRQLFELWQQA